MCGFLPIIKKNTWGFLPIIKQKHKPPQTIYPTIQQGGHGGFQVSWTPGTPGDCSFEARCFQDFPGGHDDRNDFLGETRTKMVQFGTIQKWKWNFDELWKLRWCFDLLDISWFLYIWFLINRNAVKINGIQNFYISGFWSIEMRLRLMVSKQKMELWEVKPLNRSGYMCQPQKYGI